MVQVLLWINAMDPIFSFHKHSLDVLLVSIHYEPLGKALCIIYRKHIITHILHIIYMGITYIGQDDEKDIVKTLRS